MVDKRAEDEGDKGSQADEDDAEKQAPYESGEDDLPRCYRFHRILLYDC